MPSVSAIVLNYRSARDTITCIEALLKQTIAQQMEIIVVDNHSDDESIGWIRARFGNTENVHIVESATNQGYGKGNNAGIRHATGEYILIINPDNRLEPNAAESMRKILEHNENVGIVGPALIHPDGTLRPSARDFPSMSELLSKRLSPQKWQQEYEKSMYKKASGNLRHTDWLVGACLMMKKSHCEKLNGFDERFFLFFEDIDLCRRSALLGKKIIYARDIHCLDRKRRLSDGSVLAPLWKRTTRIHMYSAIKYFWKWRRA